jgi:hypothetical protein
LPDGYEEAARETGAFTRKREIKSARDLLLLVFLYIVHGMSYLSVSATAHLKGINLSDVSFMERFAKCGKLIEWILENIRPKATAHYKKPEKFEKYSIKALDASVVTSGGKVRITHRLHYAIDVFDLKSDQYKITSEKTGESMTNFKAKPGDLFIGDRAYGTVTSMEHCCENEADFIFRLRKNAFDIYYNDGKKIDLINMLQNLRNNQKLNMKCYYKNAQKKYISIRVCAMIKPKNLVETPENDTEFMNNFIVVATSILDPGISAGDVLDLYRVRWQVELYFKRLKSLLGFGDVPNKTEANVKIWLQAKLLCAILLEITMSEVDFSPSG